jgi:peptidoglycan/xylan/chitin deacetylase (PgdA/CDA1 family)
MLTVSNYHYIREDFEAPFPSIFGLTPKAFEQQLCRLSETGTFLHPETLLADPDAVLSDDKNHILITFDDGLREQVDFALPVLDRLGIPALFFVNTVNRDSGEVSLVHQIHLVRGQIPPTELLRIFAGNGQAAALSEQEKRVAERHYNYDDRPAAHLKYLLNLRLTADEQRTLIGPLFSRYFDAAAVLDDLYMQRGQIAHLARKGFLGSHTHSHVSLGAMPREGIIRELETSRSLLQLWSGKAISAVSYPFGDAGSCAPPVPQLAAEAGYTLGFTTERGINKAGQDKLSLKRFDCNDLPGGKNYRE